VRVNLRECADVCVDLEDADAVRVDLEDTDGDRVGLGDAESEPPSINVNSDASMTPNFNISLLNLYIYVSKPLRITIP